MPTNLGHSNFLPIQISWFVLQGIEVGRVKHMGCPYAFLQSLVGSYVWMPTDHLEVPKLYPVGFYQMTSALGDSAIKALYWVQGF